MARQWFRPDNTSGLTTKDLEIINRAARHLHDDHGLPMTNRWLMEIRMTYQPGMSAQEVIDLVNAEREDD